MKKKEDFILYIINIFVLTFISFMSFKGMVISSLAYLITCDIIQVRKDDK